MGLEKQKDAFPEIHGLHHHLPDGACFAHMLVGYLDFYVGHDPGCHVLLLSLACSQFFLDLAPLFFAWAAFSISYWLIPNTKVEFKYAAVAGAFCAIAFYIIQLLFINGQIYVSKYNAIYGSFAFLPLFLIWLQLSWLIMLIGCVLTYSMQNVFTFNLLGNDQQLTVETRLRTAIIVMAVVAQRFLNRQEPLTSSQFAADYNLPVRVLGQTLQRLKEGGLIYSVNTKRESWP